MNIDISDIKATKNAQKKESLLFTEFLKKDISFSKGLSNKKKLTLFSELELLLSSGVDIKNALDLIVDEQKKQKDSEFYNDIRKKVFAGSGLSDVLINSKKFNNYENFTIKIGEESGNLPEVLKQLTIYYENKIKLRRQLLSALSYPAFVLIAAFATVMFLLSFLVPMFEDVFKRFSGELPIITQRIINLSHTVSENGFFIFLIIMAFSLLYLIIRKRVWFKKTESALTLKIPVMGDIIRKNNLARLCQALSMLISSKVPLTEAIKLTKDITLFYPIAQSLPIILKNIEKGESLNNSMKNFNIYDSRMVYLIKIGEEVNQLDTIFNRLQQQYTADVEHSVSVLTGLLEPFLIIFVGLIVGIILISMYLPLFQISNTFMY